MQTTGNDGPIRVVRAQNLCFFGRLILENGGSDDRVVLHRVDYGRTDKAYPHAAI